MVKKKISKKNTKSKKHNASKNTSKHKIKEKTVVHKKVHNTDNKIKHTKVSKSQEKKDIITIIALSVLIVIIIIISIISGNNKDVISSDYLDDVNQIVDNSDTTTNNNANTNPVEETEPIPEVDENLSYEEVLQQAMDLQLEMFGDIKEKQLEVFETWYDELEINKEEMDVCLEENNHLNLDLNMDDSILISKIYKDIQLASASGFTGTPGMFVNNYKLDGFKDYDYFVDLIEACQNDLESETISFIDENITDFNTNTTDDPILHVIYNKDCDFTTEYVDNMLNLVKAAPYDVLFTDFFNEVEVVKVDYRETDDYLTNVLKATKVNSIPFFYLDGDVESLLENYDENKTQLFNSLFTELPIGGYMLAIPPQQVIDYSLLDDEYDYIYGQEDAPVTIYIFEDYDCTFCEKLDKEVLPDIISNYVDNGIVNIVVKDFVIYQTQSLFPAIFSRCAQRQDKYWPVHKKLYENRSLFGGSLVQEIYTKYEGQISALQEQYNKFSE